MSEGTAPSPLTGAGIRSRLQRHRSALLVGFAVLVIVLGANAVRRALKGSSAFDETTQYSRQLVLEGRNVYETHGTQGSHTKYPPFFFVFTAPFAALPLGLSASLWYLLNLALACVAVALAVRAMWSADAPRGPSWMAYAAVGALNAVIVFTNLSRLQVNILIVFFVVLAVYLATRVKDDLAGFAIAIAFMLKLTPILVLAYFVWKRRWRTLRGFGVGVVLAWTLQVIVLGPEQSIEVTRSWLAVLREFAQGGALAEGDPGGIRHTNQSLAAAFFRFFTHRPADGGDGSLYLNVLALSDQTVNLLIRSASVALLLATLWLTRALPLAARSLRFGLEVSLVLILMLLISPISWSNHYVALIVPWAAAVEGLRRMGADDPQRRRFAIALAVSALFSLGALSRLTQAFSFQLIGALVLAGAIVWLLRRLQPAVGDARDPAPSP